MIRFDDNVELRPNKCGEMGCFALRDFAAGELLGDGVSAFTPEEAPGWIEMPLAEARRLPPASRAAFLKFGWSVDFEGRAIGPLDARFAITKENFINHSCDPNVWCDEIGDRWIAGRDIAAGAPRSDTGNPLWSNLYLISTHYFTRRRFHSLSLKDFHFRIKFTIFRL